MARVEVGGAGQEPPLRETRCLLAGPSVAGVTGRASSASGEAVPVRTPGVSPGGPTSPRRGRARALLARVPLSAQVSAGVARATRTAVLRVVRPPRDPAPPAPALLLHPPPPPLSPPTPSPSTINAATKGPRRQLGVDASSSSPFAGSPEEGRQQRRGQLSAEPRSLPGRGREGVRRQRRRPSTRMSGRWDATAARLLNFHARPWASSNAGPRPLFPAESECWVPRDRPGVGIAGTGPVFT